MDAIQIVLKGGSHEVQKSCAEGFGFFGFSLTSEILSHIYMDNPRDQDIFDKNPKQGWPFGIGKYDPYGQN